MAKPTTGYTNGSDLLIQIGGKPVGHCTTHTLTFSSEAKDLAVKPVATADYDKSLWKSKIISTLSASISAEGMMVYDETEGAYAHLLAAYKTGAPVQVKAFARGDDANPYVTGSFVISSLEMQAPAGDEATYSVSLDNADAVDIDPTKLANGTISNPSPL